MSVVGLAGGFGCTRHDVVDYVPLPTRLVISDIRWPQATQYVDNEHDFGPDVAPWEDIEIGVGTRAAGSRQGVGTRAAGQESRQDGEQQGSQNTIQPVDFDRVQIEIQGFEWNVIATVSADYIDGTATLLLPSVIAPEQLCKVARDDPRDYTGFWPATEVSDRTARVATFGDIVAYKGDNRVGRIYLTTWDGDPAKKGSAYYAYFCYQDRHYTLSGRSMSSSEGTSGYFLYRASFSEGWNRYYKHYNSFLTDVSTYPPYDAEFVWRFEKW